MTQQALKCKFISPYKHAPWYVDEPDHFDIGHEVVQDSDGWFDMYPNNKTKGLRMSPSVIKQLINSKYLKQI